MKKILSMAAIFACACLLSAGFCMAEEKGPAEIILESTVDPASKAKPAFFPHGRHQAVLTCGDCHHGKSADGKQVPYTEGQKVETCQTCHNSKAGLDEKLATFKDAAHARCKECHKTMKKEGKQTGPTGCSGCHKKDL